MVKTFQVSQEVFDKAVEVISNHEIMDATEITAEARWDVCVLLEEEGLGEMSSLLENLSLLEFEDFLVNNCGDD